MNVHCIAPDRYFGSNCYLLESNDEWVIIDPSVSFDEVKERIGEKGIIKSILLTHAHFDHIIGINSFSKNGIEVCVGSGDASMLSDPYLNCYLGFLGIHDGYYGDYRVIGESDVIPFGSESIKVLSTPGHTPGGLSYIVGNNVFVGDTLFAEGGYGRCDLPLGDISELEHSLIKLFARFRDETFYPGHGKPSTFAKCIDFFN